MKRNILRDEAEEVMHRGKVTNSLVFSEIFEGLHTAPEALLDLREGRVPVWAANRPDLISEVFYDTYDQSWLLQVANSVEDPFEGFQSGDRLFIPRL